MQYKIETPKFAYLVGYFVADGSFYKDNSGFRFEFCDGSSIKEELHYSQEFISEIGSLFKKVIGININIRRRGNRYALSFRNKNFAEFFIKRFGFKPGKKAHIVDIPAMYKSTDLEKYFWLGVMDGDGMVARGSRKIAIESVSNNLITSFNDFLNRNSIKHVLINREINNAQAFGIRLSSAFFSKYAETVGFLHPRKRKWLEEHLKKSEFYTKNEVLFNDYLLRDDILNYSKIFETERVFVVNGKSILKERKLKHYGRANKSFTKLFLALSNKGLSHDEIFRILSQHKWKMSKGSTSQVNLPLTISNELLQIAKLVRIYNGQIRVSREYTKAMHVDYDKVILDIEKIFGIKAQYSCKNEVIFSSGVLKLFFSKVIKRLDDKVSLPEWHKELR